MLNGAPLTRFTYKRFEQAFANSLVFGRTDDSFWIGLNDQARGGSYRWLTGDEVSFTNWNRDQPSRCRTPERHSNSLFLRTSVPF